MTAATWRGDDGATPRMTAKVLRWYRLRLPAVFYQTENGKKYPMEPTRRAELVAWYAERPEEFLLWNAEEEYRGKRYNLGAWRLDIAAINAALPLASREIEADKRRRAYAERGPVTEADVDAALARLEGTAPLTPEVDANQLYVRDDPRRTALLHNHWRAEDHWPRNCHRCGQEFKPAKPSQKRTCSDCLAAAKADREQAKQRS
jgi:hypothetical protein